MEANRPVPFAKIDDLLERVNKALGTVVLNGPLTPIQTHELTFAIETVGGLRRLFSEEKALITQESADGDQR